MTDHWDDILAPDIVPQSKIAPVQSPTVNHRLTLQFMDGCIPIYKVGVVFGMMNDTLVEENYGSYLKAEPRQQSDLACLLHIVSF